MLTPCKISASRLLTLVLTQSKAPTSVNPMPPLTGNAIGNQMIYPQARVASASDFVSASKHQREDIADRVFLQVSSSNLFSDLGIPGNSQAEKVSRAPAWDGITFTPQPQWDRSGTSAPVGIPDITSCVQFTTLVPSQEKLIHRSYLILAETGLGWTISISTSMRKHQSICQ